MMIVVPKWQVTASLSNGKNVQVWISDPFIENVLRKVADMSFDANPLVRTERVTVESVVAKDGAGVQVGIQTSAGYKVRTEPPNQ